MNDNREFLTVATMAKALGVSRGGYYQWPTSQNELSPRKKDLVARDRKAQEAFEQSKQRNGARRIQAELSNQGHHHNIKTTDNNMKRQDLVAKVAHKFTVTTDSNHNLSTSPNLLARDFSPDKANQKWAGDITYLHTSEGWLYLSVIIDRIGRDINTDDFG